MVGECEGECEGEGKGEVAARESTYIHIRD